MEAVHKRQVTPRHAVLGPDGLVEVVEDEMNRGPREAESALDDGGQIGLDDLKKGFLPVFLRVSPKRTPKGQEDEVTGQEDEVSSSTLHKNTMTT